MDKHTPGPWEANRWRVCAGCGEGQRISVICDTASNIQTRTAENEANARLIAAAPELLDALRAVVAISDRKHDAWDAAKAAIAKATNQPKSDS